MADVSVVAGSILLGLALMYRETSGFLTRLGTLLLFILSSVLFVLFVVTNDIRYVLALAISYISFLVLMSIAIFIVVRRGSK